MMKSILLLITLLAHYHVNTQPTTPAEIVQELGNRYPKNTQIAIAIIKGKQVDYHGFIHQDSSYQVIDNQHSVFEIGSITKVFTSTLLAQAIIDQKVKPQQQLQPLIPFKLKGRPKITLQQLSNHTSGLPRLPENMFLVMAQNAQNPYKQYDEALLKEFATKELDVERKRPLAFAYSNLGAGMLGYALSKAYKKTYEQLLKEFVFKPFGLTNSYTTIQQVPEEKLVKGLDITGAVVPNWEWDVLAPAGCMLSSVQDLARFILANISSDHPVLERQQQPSFQHSETMHLALGWFIIKEKKKEYYFHNGGTGGYTSALFFNKEHQEAVIILSNVPPNSPHRGRIEQMARMMLP